MAVFTIGSFVSKLLVFFLVPFYTSVLTESEYGIADVMQSSLLLLVPLLSINAGEAALRYGLENRQDREMILKYGLKRCFISMIPGTAISLSLSFLFPESRIFFLLFILLYAANSLYEFMLLYCQGTEETEKMITGSISSTVILIASNLILLLGFRAGIYGYVFSQIIAFSCSALIMFILTGGPEKIRMASKNQGLEEEMKGYGRNMLLYSTASWVNNAIDRYFILFLLGSAQNGLYGAAYKIPAILMVFQRIFAMAWQMSAVKEYKGEDSPEYFSGMYRIYQTALVTGCGLIILFLKPIASFMFKKSFFDAWILVPPLLISVVFGALEGFLGSIALAFKDPESMGKATGTGAVFNIILNYILIRRFGAFGAAAATLISYFIMFALAYFFVSRHIRLKTGLIRDLGAYALLILESALVIGEVKNHLIWNTLILLILIFLYREVILGTIKKLYSIVDERFGCERLSELILILMFLFFIYGSFTVRGLYEAIAPWGTAVFFLGTVVIYIMSTRLGASRLLSFDRYTLMGVAAVIITPVNLFLIHSGMGAMLVVFDQVMICALILKGDFRLSDRGKRILSFLAAALMLIWYPVVRWDYGFNMVGLVFLILLIFGELILEYMKNDMELEYLKYVQILFFITSILLSICYQARSSALSMAVFGVAFLVTPVIIEKRVLQNIWIFIFTLGSLLFSLLLPLIGRMGWNVRILYKDTLSGRELIWGELWREFLKKPVTGIGSSYEMKSFFMFEVHNGLLDILVVHGLPVFILIFLLLISTLKRLFSRDLSFCPDKRIAFAGVYALLFASFFENGFIVTPYSMVFFVLMLIAG